MPDAFEDNADSGPCMTHKQLMASFSRAGVYLVTSGGLSMGRGTPDVIRRALDGGVRLVQLREKGVCDRELHRLAVEAREITARYRALLIINDRVDIALAAGADGVHLGQDDLPASIARRMCPDLVIGVSTHTEEEAIAAQRDGASYVNIGPLFQTATKEWNSGFLGIEGLRRISRAVSIPFTVMGGIKKEHVPALAGEGAKIIAVVTAITAAADPEAAARELVTEINNAFTSEE